MSSFTNLLNKVLDPEDEGADGVDFAQNLVFTNFTPSIVAILGDAKADDNLPAFKREGATNANGQGLYRLTRTLPLTTGSRIQQIADPAALPGSSARWIKLAIARSDLGNIPAGSRIKVAVVAARGIVDTNSAPFRDIDNSFIGNRIFNSGTNRVVIEGVEIELSEDQDPDEDGLEDDKEIAAGTDPLDADTDRDGFTDFEELYVGTTPTDPRSQLRLALSKVGKDSVLLEWPSLPWRHRTVEMAMRIEGPYSSVAEYSPGRGVDIMERLAILTTNQAGFFRIRYHR